MQQGVKIITKIDANPMLSERRNEYRQLRVAAYCRVSTDSDDQVESYKAQVAYYTDAIAKNPRWKMADIYADEGITGTMTKKRDNFNRMIKDCERGRVDYILCKSVSRFARNTVDALRVVRKLKARGIGVYFEEQCLDTLKADNEMFLGIHSVMAQSESETISANVRWGLQQRMKSGTYKFNFHLYGYERGEDGEPKIVEEEAVYIKKIYDMYLQGKSLSEISRFMESEGVAQRSGSYSWGSKRIKDILCNERYCGDMLMQKTFVKNPINKKQQRNRGELPKYLIQNNHPAIIERSVFQAVQAEMARRTSRRKVSDRAKTELGKYSGKYALTELLVCGECGSAYRRKTWNKRNGEKEGVWLCINRIENGKDACQNSAVLHEDVLQRTICRGLQRAYQEFGGGMDCITSALVYATTKADEVMDVYAIEQQMKQIDQTLDEVIVLRERTQGDKSKYDDEIRKLSQQLVALRQQRDLEKKKMEKMPKAVAEVEKIKKMFEEKENFITYRDDVVRCVVECIRVKDKNTISIILKGGYTVEESLA
ncbi:MAG: recombinase family protein [Ruminococcus sp.]